MKYIFNNYWFEHQGTLHGPVGGDFQEKPKGGWKNWTIKHNLDWMLKMYREGEEFTLIGEVDDLVKQAKNAGKKPTTKCTLGIEVIFLLALGYTIQPPDKDSIDKSLCIFQPPENEPTEQMQQAIARIYGDAVLQFDTNGTPSRFWTTERQGWYLQVLDAL